MRYRTSLTFLKKSKGMKKEGAFLDRRIEEITSVLLLLLLTHSTVLNVVSKSWGGRGYSWATLNKSLLLFLNSVEGLTSVAHAQNSLKIPLYIKDKEILVEAAKTPEERVRGLMGRKNLGKDEGMFFVFEEEDYHSFWMKNTRIPLTIAFIDRGCRIVSIEDMRPLTLDTHAPPRPILYALEMQKGWFSSNGIKVGDIVKFSK